MSFWQDIFNRKASIINEPTVITYLKADRKRAERLIAEAFEGHTIRKCRSDKGSKKATKEEVVSLAPLSEENMKLLYPITWKEKMKESENGE